MTCALSGSLPATVRNILESGAQRKAERHGVAQVGNRNEFIESGAFGCGTAHLGILQDIAEDLFDDLEEDGYFQLGRSRN